MDKKLSLKLYRQLYTIYKCEKRIQELYYDNDMKTPMHMSKGEEAIVVGVINALKEQDQVIGSYRTHALYLAKTDDIEGFFSELYGKEDSILQGRGGSMHLCNMAKGYVGASAIVAGQIPIALGLAHANKIKKNGKIVTVFFGDGAMDEGVFWESINIASLYKLPIIFVCQDNGLAVHTFKRDRVGYDKITIILQEYNFNIWKDGDNEKDRDAYLYYELTKCVLEEMKKNGKPGFLYTNYYRFLEHVGVNEDFYLNYRGKENRTHPLNQFKKILGYKKEHYESLEEPIDNRIEVAIINAQKAKCCSSNDALKGVYSE